MDTIDVFISHAEEDADIAGQIAADLEQAGFRTWYYERDGVPGPPYVRQVAEAIDRCRAILLVISPNSIASMHVTNEIVQGHESGKVFIPLLRRLTHAEFQKQRPEWRQILGAATSAPIPPEGVAALTPRVLRGLEGFGIRPSSAPGPHPGAGEEVPPSPSMGDATIDDSEVPLTEEDLSVCASWDEAFEEDRAPEASFLTATIADMDPASGILADLLLPEKLPEATPTFKVRFREPLRGDYVGQTIQIDFSKCPTKPGFYLRLQRLRLGNEWWSEDRPVILRVYRRDRVPEAIHRGRRRGKGVEIQQTPTGKASIEAVGFCVRERFVEMIPSGTPLPHIRRQRFRTTRKNQQAIRVATAVGEGRRELAQVRIAGILPGPAGGPWIECTFRIDPDGRFTLTAWDPISDTHAMAIAGWRED